MDKQYKDYLDGKSNTFPYIDDEEREIVEAMTPEFYEKVANRTEQDRKKSIDDFYKQFDLDKANKRSIEFENKDLEKLRKELTDNQQNIAINIIDKFLKEKEITKSKNDNY